MFAPLRPEAGAKPSFADPESRVTVSGDSASKVATCYSGGWHVSGDIGYGTGQLGVRRHAPAAPTSGRSPDHIVIVRMLHQNNEENTYALGTLNTSLAVALPWLRKR